MPENTTTSVPAEIAGFFKQVRSTVEDIQAIAKVLNGKRSCVIEVDNNTKLTWTVEKHHHSHGGFADPPPRVQLGPESANTFGTQNKSNSIMTGTEGQV